MGPKISICRKKDNVYLKLMGDFNPSSAFEILHAVERVVSASLRFASPGSKVFYSFKAHARVKMGPEAPAEAKKARPRVKNPGAPPAIS